MTNANPSPTSSPSDPPPSEEPPISAARRTFLARATLSMAGLAAVIGGIPFVGFLFSPLWRREAEIWRTVGALEDFPVGTTHKVVLLDPAPVPWAGFTARSAAWLRRESEQEFVAFSIHCTHTGCPVRWEEGAGLFMCPCHGGAFYRDGSVAAGPPPAPLERQPVRVHDGQVQVRTMGLPTP